MSVKIALIVSAPIELTLNAGREEIEPGPPAPYRSPDDPPFLNIGLAETDELHFSGALIGDPEHLAAALSIAYYFPDEEKAGEARPVDLAEARLVVRTTPRQKAAPGWRWRYRLESRRPYREIKIYEGGFQPPFKASDLTLQLEHLINYNYDGYILSRVDYLHKAPAYTEADWRFPQPEAEGFL
ncbi:MAG: hypothetical protein LBS31_06705 [Candidatus Adiutrix sp.]|jgi:hypothetical protein|nr:hypothetical protein [Candidatus Adiutrix sp.]